MSQGTGNIGRVMLSKLKEAKEFDLRVITRLDSTKAESPGVETVKVDYESQDSLVGVIRGCDIVVNALSVMANQAHYAVLDAVIEAQVPRYYPSDWGSHPPAEGRALPLLQAIPWIDTRRRINYLVETAAIEGKLTYTSLKGGAWLETVLKLPVMFSLPERKFLMHKYPDTDYSYSSKDMYAEALLNALRLPDEETKNRYFEVELYRVSQRRTLELLRQAYPDIEFEQVSAEKKSGSEKLCRRCKPVR
jgi:uncharacterized protein YbjT (DUF2867 family)